MKNFITDNFLLQTEVAQRLYHDYAKNLPIIDYHNHLPPKSIAEDEAYENITQLWLAGDHYKWRAMRVLGIEEKYITGSASDEEKFLTWAAAVPYTMRNPLYHWTHLELKNSFGITDLLSEKNAKAVYHHCNSLLQGPEFTSRRLLEKYNVEMVGTTDDPADNLYYHKEIKYTDFNVKVLPSFRPDKAFNLAGGNAFRAYLQQLSEASGVTILNIDTLLEALQNRMEYFHEIGCRISDHGLSYIPLPTKKASNLDNIFVKVLAGDDQEATAHQDDFTRFILMELCRMYHQKGWVQQFHLGPLRDNNSRKLQLFGPNTGFDSIGDFNQALGLTTFLDDLEKTDQLAKTILYNLNPSDNAVFAAMTGNFQSEKVKGKVQFGSGWWFMDQLDGMRDQINTLSNIGLISCFIGMLTDSRSFLSFSRHEYFRRLLCDILANDINQGLLPADIPWIGKLVQDICYYNAKNYFPISQNTPIHATV
ncbi:glucuronate isomerase [Adhaeribacter aquaticus]|uniref:glucuronate isomerase n=1 Tax=Adhaeribacter aquaticus TaxID=299567 RepID=UPI000420324B|nr:glucuronate isomerase [Adhaeribacter aquaticus]